MMGKSVLVTGASGGIGFAVCRRFAGLGARVWGHAHRRVDRLRDQLGELPGSGHRAIGGDLRDPFATRELIDTVVDESGSLDVLVNSAGVFFPHRVDEVDFEAWRRAWHETLALNLVAAANTSFCAALGMERSGGGTIINISSRGAFRGEPESPAYAASKAGLNAMSQSLALALAPKSIYVFVLAPGFVETEMVTSMLQGPEGESIRQQSPFGRVAAPEEVAYWASAVANPKARFATGTIIDINGASYLRS